MPFLAPTKPAERHKLSKASIFSLSHNTTARGRPNQTHAIHASVREPALRPASYARHNVQNTKAATTATDGIVRRMESCNLQLLFICVSDLFPRGACHARYSWRPVAHGMRPRPIECKYRSESASGAEPGAGALPGWESRRRKMQDVHLNAEFSAGQASGGGEPSARTPNRRALYPILPTIRSGIAIVSQENARELSSARAFGSAPFRCTGAWHCPCY